MPNKKILDFIERHFSEHCSHPVFLQYFTQQKDPNHSHHKNNLIKTHLYLADLNSNHSFIYLMEMFQSDILCQLTIIDLAHFEPTNKTQLQHLKTLVTLTQTRCPNLKQFLLPRFALNQLDLQDVNILFKENDCVKFKNTFIKGKENIKDPEWGTSQSSNLLRTTQPKIEIKQEEISQLLSALSTTQPEKNKLYLSSSPHSSTFHPDESTSSKFKMIKRGELLNKNMNTPQSLRIRTGIIERDLNKGLAEHIYFPHLPEPHEEIKSNEMRYLTRSDLSDCKRSTQTFYFNFQTELNSNQWVRLLSIDSEYMLHGIIDEQQKKVCILKADDGFFYARSNEDYTLNYVISLPLTLKYNFTHLPMHVQELIRDYKSSPNYTTTSFGDIPMPSFDSENPNIYLKAVYETRAGRCTHRVAAVKYALEALSPLPEVRIVGIDFNHHRLEIKTNPIEGDIHWIQVDLGGGIADLEYPPQTPQPVLHQQDSISTPIFTPPVLSTELIIQLNTSLQQNMDSEARRKSILELIRLNMNSDHIHDKQILLNSIIHSNKRNTLLG